MSSKPGPKAPLMYYEGREPYTQPQVNPDTATGRQQHARSAAVGCSGRLHPPCLTAVAVGCSSRLHPPCLTEVAVGCDRRPRINWLLEERLHMHDINVLQPFPLYSHV